MNRGFSLIELIITCALVVMLLSFAVPTFRSVQEDMHVNNLAEELNGFLLEAKSKATLRNETLTVHINVNSNTLISDGSWNLSLQDPLGTELLVVDGANFPQTSFSHSYGVKKITFEPIRGWPGGGTLKIAPTTNSADEVQVIISNPPGRIRLCGSTQEVGNYVQC